MQRKHWYGFQGSMDSLSQILLLFLCLRSQVAFSVLGVTVPKVFVWERLSLCAGGSRLSLWVLVPLMSRAVTNSFSTQDSEGFSSTGQLNTECLFPQTLYFCEREHQLPIITSHWRRSREGSASHLVNRYAKRKRCRVVYLSGSQPRLPHSPLDLNFIRYWFFKNPKSSAVFFS